MIQVTLTYLKKMMVIRFKVKTMHPDQLSLSNPSSANDSQHIASAI
jgi:hypothetical protein